MLRLRNLIFFLYVLNVLFITAYLERDLKIVETVISSSNDQHQHLKTSNEVSSRRRNTSEPFPNNAEGTGGEKKWINRRLKYTHTNPSFETELQNSKPMKSHCKYDEKHEGVTVNSFVDKTHNAGVIGKTLQPSENENLTKDLGNIQTNVELNRKKSRHQKRYKNDNQRFSCQNIALNTNHNISHNNEDNFNKIKYIIGQDYDYNHALLDRLTSNSERKLPPNYKVLYNENFDPTIIYNGPSEEDVYYNTKTHLQHKANQFEEYPSHFGFFNRKPANPLQMDKRYVRITNVPEDKIYIYNNNHSYSPNFSRHGALNWNQNSSNIRKINEIRFKTVKKGVGSSPVALQMKQEKTMSKIRNDKSTIVHTTESHHKTNNLMEHSYSTNITLRKSQYEAKQLSSDKIKENAGCCLATIETGSAKCHPSCSPPKFHRDQSVASTEDKEYAAVLSGSLSEKIVQKILDKVTKNEKMAIEFGLCFKNMTDTRDYYVNLTNSCTVCTPLHGELQCFLKWLLSADLTRKPRSYYFNVKPERNYLFDDVFLNPWQANEKINSIALPPSVYGFSQQPIYSFGKKDYFSKLFNDLSEDDEDVRKDRLVYKSKIILFPENDDQSV